MLFVPALAFGAPPAPVQGPAQAPNKAVQAPTQAPVQAPAKGTAMAPNYSGYRTYSYQPTTTPMNYGYGYGNAPGYRPRMSAGFNSAAFKATGQPYVP